VRTVALRKHSHPGEGKTHLAVASGGRLCAEGIPTTFLPVNLLFEEIAAAKAAGKYLQLVRQLNKSKVFVRDDFGLRSYTKKRRLWSICWRTATGVVS
jgi:DNA replication protein DnaC